MEKLIQISAGLVFIVFLIGCFFSAPFIFLYEVLTSKNVKWFDELAGPGY